MGVDAASAEHVLVELAGIDKEILKRFKPCSAAAIGSVVAWLADNEPREDWNPREVLRGPAIAKELGLLDCVSHLKPDYTGASHE